MPFLRAGKKIPKPEPEEPKVVLPEIEPLPELDDTLPENNAVVDTVEPAPEIAPATEAVETEPENVSIVETVETEPEIEPSAVDAVESAPEIVPATETVETEPENAPAFDAVEPATEENAPAVVDTVESVPEIEPVTETVEPAPENAPATETVEPATEENAPAVADTVEPATEENAPAVADTVESAPEENAPAVDSVEPVTENSPAPDNSGLPEEILEAIGEPTAQESEPAKDSDSGQDSQPDSSNTDYSGENLKYDFTSGERYVDKVSTKTEFDKMLDELANISKDLLSWQVEKFAKQHTGKFQGDFDKAESDAKKYEAFLGGYITNAAMTLYDNGYRDIAIKQLEQAKSILEARKKLEEETEATRSRVAQNDDVVDLTDILGLFGD